MKKSIWFLTITCLTLVSSLSVVFNYTIQFVIEGVKNGNPNQFQLASFSLVLTITLLLLFEYGRQVLNAKYLNQVGAAIHQTSLLRYFSDHHHRDKSNPADKVSALNNDINMVKELHYDTQISLIQGVVSFVFSFSALLSLNALTAIGILSTLIVPIIIPMLFKKVLVANQEKVSQTKARYNQKATDYLSNLTVIRNHSGHQAITADTLATYSDMNQAVFNREKTTALINVLTGLSFYSTVILILVLGGWQVFEGHLSLGGLVAIYSISQELTLPTSLIADALADMTSVQTIREELLQEPYSDTGAELTALPSLTLKDVSYQIDDQTVLLPLTYHFQHGQNYLITGPSGSGKSTLLNILAGAITNYSGQVLANGQDTRQITHQSLQNHLAYLPQQGQLFHDSIWNNLTGFSGDNSRAEELMALIQTFHLSDRFPTLDSLQEVYHEDNQLSGGQIQRLLLIRALFERKPWLLIDEGLSGLDQDTYDQLETYLLSQNHLSLIHVSHRPNPETSNYQVLKLGS